MFIARVHSSASRPLRVGAEIVAMSLLAAGLAILPLAPASAANPIPQMNAVTTFTTTTATLGGSVNARNNPGVTADFCYNAGASFNAATCTSVAATPSSITGNSATTIAGSLSGLTPGAQYSVAARYILGGVSTPSSAVQFTTSKAAQTIRSPNRPTSPSAPATRP